MGLDKVKRKLKSKRESRHSKGSHFGFGIREMFFDDGVQE
jgi:hypothetical protein